MSISMVLYAGLAAGLASSLGTPVTTPPSALVQLAPLALAMSPAPVASQPAAADITTADELLTRLETADAGLRTLTADIQYVRIFGMMGDRQIRVGALAFMDERSDAQRAGTKDTPSPAVSEGNDPAIEANTPTPTGTLVTTTQVLPPARRFAVRFNTVQVGSREERSNETYVFDGSVLAHTEPERRQVTRYEVPQGDQARDPLKLGEGPLPLPIAQKREDILTRFDATLLPATQDLEGEDDKDTAALHAFVAGSYQLRLVPKPEFAEQMDAREIRLWYRPVELKVGEKATQRLLPRMAWTINSRDDVAMVRLINVKVNPAIEPSVVSVDAIPEGFEVIRRQLAAPNSR